MSSSDNDRTLPTEGENEGGRDLKFRDKYLHKDGDADIDETGRADAGSDDSDSRKRGTDYDRREGDHHEEDEQDTVDDEQDDGDGDDDDDEASPEEKRKKKKKRIIILACIAAVFIIAGIAWLLLYLIIFSKRVTTEDAYVKGDMVVISSRVAGTVVELDVEETERVHAGQVLLRLDSADGQASLMGAEGELAQAVRQVRGNIEKAREADAAVAQRRAQYEIARDQYQRRHPLLAAHAVSREQVVASRRQMQAALGALNQARAQATAAHAQVDGTTVYNSPAVIQARAKLRQAWVNNDRNTIVSPVEGFAARRQVQVGQRVQPGQDLLTVVPLDNLWVDANLKETQLTDIRIGQPVSMVADVYPDVTFKGNVVGIGSGTGSAFSLLPAQNASGNWIKVVQRIPVRISLKPGMLEEHPLRVGLSMSVDVDISSHKGSVLTSGMSHIPPTTTPVYEKEIRAADARAEEIIKANIVRHPAASDSGKSRRGH